MIPGDLVGPYRIERELGRGGMAVVYLARHQRLDRPVALKILHENLQRDAAFVERFLFEARAAARLDHNNIIAMHDAGEIDGIDYIAMEYVEGESLADILRRSPGPLPLDFTLSIISQVAAALDYAHARGIVHRDIKPSNIVVRDNGHALLTDFGIARAASMGDAGTLTNTGAILGTPEYMSPEQAEGRSVDGRSDVYSLGILAYRMLTGRNPFGGETPQATLYAHVHQPLPDPRAANPDLPAAAFTVLSTAAAKDRARRYPTAVTFAQNLRAALRSPAALPAPEPARPPGFWLYAAIGFLLGLAALSIAAWLILRDNAPAAPPVAPAPPTVAAAGAGTDATATPAPALVPPLTDTPTTTLTPTAVETPTLTPSPTATPTPAVTLPPRIAYVSDRSGSPQIYAIYSDGSGDVQLTDAGRNDQPFWSPDGSSLFFTSDRDGEAALWTMQPDGGDPRQLLAAPGAVAFSISPDAAHIAYARIGDAGYDIFLDGAPWVTMPGDQTAYLWSPDSNRIVFEGGSGSQTLYVITVGATRPQPLTADSYSSWNPAWSPNSGQIAFASTRDGNAGIYTIGSGGNDPLRITPLDVWSQAPAWSPDGSAIAHIGGEPGNTWGLYLVAPDGSRRTRLFSPAFSAAAAVWSPDSSQIAFIFNDSSPELAVINRDGSGFVRLTDNAGRDWNPVWEPK